MAHGAFQVTLGYRAMAVSLNVALLSGRSVHLSASLASTVDQLRLQAQMSLTLGQKPFRSLKKASDALASDLFHAVSCGFPLRNAWCQAPRVSRHFEGKWAWNEPRQAMSQFEPFKGPLTPSCMLKCARHRVLDAWVTTPRFGD